MPCLNGVYSFIALMPSNASTGQIGSQVNRHYVLRWPYKPLLRASQLLVAIFFRTGMICEMAMEVRRSRSRKKKLVRGDPVVRRVLEATLEEMAQVGYQSLRMEDVAARAKVNKTTVYRRWPTKKDLLRNALLKLMESKIAAIEALPDSGSFREDLLTAGRFGIRSLQTPESQSLLRFALAEQADPELIAIGKSLQAQRGAMYRGLFERAKTRGEFSGDIESMMVIMDVFRGVLIGKIFLDHEPPDEEYLKRVVDLILYGAIRGGTQSRPA